MSKKEVVKASGAIQMTNKISLLQRRTWNILLANAFDELLEKEEYKIEVKQLVNILNFGSKNEEHLRGSLKDLTTTAVEWNILRKDKSAIWGVTTLLSQVEIKDGLCTYAYSPALKKKLFQPSMYAKINLSIQNRFDSKHSLALYELCVDYYDVKRKKGETPFISVEDFRHLMGIDDKEYSEFKYLNKRTIVEPISEINEKSDIIVEVEYKRLGRKVAFIKFVICSHDAKSSEEENRKQFDFGINDVHDQRKYPVDFESPANFLTFYRVSFNDIDYFMRNIPFNSLEEAIQEIKHKIKEGVIHYPKAYILTVLNALVVKETDVEKINTYNNIEKQQKTEYTKNNLPEYLHFLLDYDLLETKQGHIKMMLIDKTVSVNKLLSFGEEFWARLKKRFILATESDFQKRFDIIFEEGVREEDFIYHPIYQALLEAGEAKKDFLEKKIYYLSLIIKLYWGVLNKEVTLEEALSQIMTNE